MKIRSLTPEFEAEIRAAIAAERRRYQNDPRDAELQPDKAPDDYLVCLPSDGIPGRSCSMIYSRLCAVVHEVEVPGDPAGSKRLRVIRDGYGSPWRIRVWNIHTASVAGKCVVRTAVLKSGTRYVVPEDTTEPTTTTTDDTPPLTTSPVCAGQCKFVADAYLVWQRDSSNCGPPTTTTGGPTTTTTAAPTTTTTSGPTTTTTACCICGSVEDASTTTTSGPTTTTTAGPTTTTTACDCQYPTHCPTLAGECTYTNCSPLQNVPPACMPTTTTTGSPTTTTTCDCDAISPPAGCTLGCDWVGLPGGGGWRWVKTSDGCRSDCPCKAPDSDPFCATAHTECIPQPPPPPPGPCTGSCGWIKIAALGTWYLESADCSGGVSGCSCEPPSTDPCPPGECCPVVTPCGAPATTTTAASPTDPTHCQLICFGSTTTAGPTTTTTPDCDSGDCLFTSNAFGTGWTGPTADTCPQTCPCATPPRLPLDSCETYRSGCFGTPTTTTTAGPTTTTTAGPTTTTTAGPTTTTAGPTTTTTAGPTTSTTAGPTTTTTSFCSGTCTYTCKNLGVDGYRWQYSFDDCVGCGAEPCTAGCTTVQGDKTVCDFLTDPTKCGTCDAGHENMSCYRGC